MHLQLIGAEAKATVDPKTLDELRKAVQMKPVMQAHMPILHDLIQDRMPVALGLSEKNAVIFLQQHKNTHPHYFNYVACHVLAHQILAHDNDYLYSTRPYALQNPENVSIDKVPTCTYSQQELTKAIQENPVLTAQLVLIPSKIKYMNPLLRNDYAFDLDFIKFWHPKFFFETATPILSRYLLSQKKGIRVSAFTPLVTKKGRG